MVAKQIISSDYREYMAKDVGMADAEISSHTLKMATLWSIEDAKNFSQSGVSSENDYSQLDSHQLQRQVEAIFRRLWQFSVEDFVPSFFMPSLNVAVWKFEKFPKFSHIFLRRTYSDYRQLFIRPLGESLFELKVESGDLGVNLIVQILRITRFRIRNALVFSFALLYAVSSHCSLSTESVLPTIRGLLNTDDY